VQLPWRAEPAGGESQLGEGGSSELLAAKVDRALIDSTKVVAELNAKERSELATVLRNVLQPGASTELTDRDLRFIDGEAVENDISEESDPFDDYDDEEGSEFDSFISDDAPA
jgi:hypothetical protein